jgi:hypothetical protein
VPADRGDDELRGVRVQVADGLVMLTLSGDIGIDQISRVVTELDAACRMRSGAVAVICADDARIAPAAVTTLRLARQRHQAQGDRMRLFGGDEAMVRALLDGGLPHHGPWDANQMADPRACQR